MRMPEEVKRKPMEPIIGGTVSADATLYTDEYAIYDWASGVWKHKRVNHSAGMAVMKMGTGTVRWK